MENIISLTYRDGKLNNLSDPVNLNSPWNLLDFGSSKTLKLLAIVSPVYDFLLKMLGSWK